MEIAYDNAIGISAGTTLGKADEQAALPLRTAEYQNIFRLSLRYNLGELC